MSEGQKRTYQQTAKSRRGGKRLAGKENQRPAEAGHLGDTGRIPTGRGNRIPQAHESVEEPVQERRSAAAVQDRTEAKPSAPIWQEEPDGILQFPVRPPFFRFGWLGFERMCRVALAG